eukprot:1815559-Pyramimonas_sp.AAC.1
MQRWNARATIALPKDAATASSHRKRGKTTETRRGPGKSSKPSGSRGARRRMISNWKRKSAGRRGSVWKEESGR